MWLIDVKETSDGKQSRVQSDESQRGIVIKRYRAMKVLSKLSKLKLNCPLKVLCAWGIHRAIKFK